MGICMYILMYDGYMGYMWMYDGYLGVYVVVCWVDWCLC